jgi:hypothetical protein
VGVIHLSTVADTTRLSGKHNTAARAVGAARIAAGKTRIAAITVVIAAIAGIPAITIMITIAIIVAAITIIAGRAAITITGGWAPIRGGPAVYDHRFNAGGQGDGGCRSEEEITIAFHGCLA